MFDLNLTIAQWVLGQVGSERLPAVARDALESGLDSPTLRQLAGESNPTLADTGPQFERALDELGVARVSKSDAALILAKAYARQILTGSLSPYEGARRIWLQVWNEHRDDRYSPFVYWASEYEEDANPERRAECERAIREEALELAGQS